MKPLTFGFLLVLLVLLAAGCSSSRPDADETAIKPEDAPPPAGNAWVFVNNRQRGTTPMTIHVRRSFEENDISLRVGPKFQVIRRYEIERAVSGNRRQLDFSFGSSSVAGGYRTIDVEDLRTTRKGIILIPYYEEPIQVEDHQYQLTILVEQ